MNDLNAKVEERSDVAALLGALETVPRPWIGGEWVDGAAPLRVTNPATGEVLVDAQLAQRELFSRAIDGAAEAFERWKRTSASERGGILKRVAGALGTHRETLAALLTLEQGKPLAQAKGEVDYAASFFEWFGEEARRLGGERMPHPEAGREFLIEPVPLGVAGLITPWNFPLAQGAKKAAAALAAGCTAVWKPSELTPLVALAMGPLLKRCGVPDGVVQILPAEGPVAGEAFSSDARVAVVSVTGSTRTGQAVYAAGVKHLQRVTLELGGNAPFIVLDDADLEATAMQLLKLKLLCSGQVCVTANRVFVPRRCEEAFLDLVAARLAEVRIGDGLTPGVDAGPLIHREACERVSRFVDGAVTAGAEVVAENRSYEEAPPAEGASFHPALLLRNVPDDVPLTCEEVFGPVISVLSYEDTAEAVQRANATPYGLAGYVYGTDLSRARAVASALEVGIVGVNEWRPLKAEIPFGGVKMSGLGAEGGHEGLREFLHPKVISVPVPGLEVNE